MSRFFKNAVLSLASMAMALVVAEVVVRLFVPVRNIGPSFSEYDSVYGKRLKKNFSCTRVTPEFTMRLTTNSLGFRGPEPKSFPKNGILFIGDSFTEGYGVNDGEEFPALVRKELDARMGENRVPVVNAGAGDIGEGRWVKFLRNEGKRFAPRLIVAELMDNDFYDNLQEDLFVLAENDSLIEYDPPEPGKSRLLQRIIESVPGLPYSYLVGLIRQALAASAITHELPPSDGELAKTDRLTFRLMEEILRLCKENNWQAVVLFVGLEGRRFDEMQKLVRRYEVQYINTPSMQSRPDLFYQIDGHWNAKGHEFVANQVLDFISAARVLER
jgi:hypothetical protein